jgi:hypothetical protein
MQATASGLIIFGSVGPSGEWLARPVQRGRHPLGCQPLGRISKEGHRRDYRGAQGQSTSAQEGERYRTRGALQTFRRNLRLTCGNATRLDTQIVGSAWVSIPHQECGNVRLSPSDVPLDVRKRKSSLHLFRSGSRAGSFNRRYGARF